MAARTEPFDVIVVGAGVAGAALAAVLGREGRSVLCIERDLRQPERIVGELLQPGGFQHLTDLGLSHAVDGIDSQPVYGYGIFLYDKATCVDYVESRPDTAADDKVAGRSFHNGRFVRRLREIAASEPAVQLVEGNVLELCTEAGVVSGVTYKDSTGRQFHPRAKLTVVCDGCFSRLRREVNPSFQYSVTSQFAGLILRNVELPFPNHGHVVLCDTAPVLFYPISSTEVRCLVDIPSSVQLAGSPDALYSHLSENVATQLPTVFAGPFLEAVANKAVKTMPNRVMTARPIAVKGAILLGDSFNMRHPLTGGGMTVALSDVSILNKILARIPDLSDHERLCELLDEFYRDRRALSGTINVLANALYSVFCATDDKALVEMRSACFDYLSRGGRCSSDPISMLGGLRPRPNLLMVHFFGVAAFGCGRVLLPVPTPRRLWAAWCLLRAAFNIIKPLVDSERITLLRWLPISHLGYR